jgi:hypothetical protein
VVGGVELTKDVECDPDPLFFPFAFVLWVWMGSLYCSVAVDVENDGI